MAETITTNRKAKFNYEILETLEAGIVLQGSEVKSLLQHHASLDGSYVVINKSEAFLIDCNIDQFKQAGPFNNHEPKRERKLLLHKREIERLAEVVKAKGFTLIPISIYRDKKIKVQIGVCKGKQTQDKRQAMKERDAKKQIKTNLY